jgi:hypothetical protein
MYASDPLWIDADYDTRVGDVGFLVRHHHVLKGWVRYTVRPGPAHTNQSLCPQLTGWCGTTNDVSTHACGMTQIVALSKSGERARVRGLVGDELQAALDEAGYPDL